MDKSILIIGAPRSGKTTLAKKIAKKEGAGLINIDNIVTAFEAYPELKITHNDVVNLEKKLSPFLKLYFNELLSGFFYPEIKYVFESSYVDFETVIPFLQHSKGARIEIIGLTYNLLNEDELFNCIRKYDDSKYDWTARRDDEQLRQIVRELVKINQTFAQKFKEYHIRNFDTSFNREEVFAKIMAELT